MNFPYNHRPKVTDHGAMRISASKQDQILSVIGLTLRQDAIYYNETQFITYISEEYRNSDRYKTDEIYRMFEITLLHTSSGLRIVYTTAESYYGDRVEYKIIRMFILTRDQKQLAIDDVDFNKEVFLTPAGVVAFGAVDRDSR